MTLLNLGYIAQHQGNYAQVVILIEESLALFQKLRADRGILYCLIALAGVASATGRPEGAVRLFAVVAARHEAFGTRIEPSDRNEYDRNLAAARAQVDETAFATAWAAGQALTLEQAIEYALAETRLSVGRARS